MKIEEGGVIVEDVEIQKIKLGKTISLRVSISIAGVKWVQVGPQQKEALEFMIYHRSYTQNFSSCEINKAWKEIQAWTGYSALQTELSTHLGGDHIVSS